MVVSCEWVRVWGLGFGVWGWGLGFGVWVSNPLESGGGVDVKLAAAVHHGEHLYTRVCIHVCVCTRLCVYTRVRVCVHV